MLGTFAPELERETGILVHSIAVIVAAAPHGVLSIGEALSYGRLEPFDSFLRVRRVLPRTALVTLRGVKLSL